jgi:HK97 family phage major capsid protein
MAKIGERDGVATYRVRDWEPLEVSIVAVPADPSVAVGRSADAGIVKIIIEDHTMTTEKDPAPVPVTETRAAAAPASPTPEQIEATVEARMAAELKRREEIEAIGARFNLPVDMRSTAIRGKMTVEAFRGAALDWVGEHQATEISLRQAGVGLTQREAQSFSLLRLVDALADPGNSAKRKAAAFEFEACEAAGAKHGRAIRGQVIPVDVLAAPISGQRDLVVGTATAGGNMVATNLLAGSFIELLRNRSMVTTAGARMLAGLQGTIAIPRQSGGATAYWVAENTAVTESDQTIAQLTMSPKTVGAMTDVSRRLLINATPSIEQLVREDLAMTLAIAIDRAALYGTGTTQPVGISNAASITAGVNAVTIADVTGVVTVTYAEYVDMETQVAIDNADFGSLGYMLNQAQRGQAKLTEKFSTTGQTIWEPGNTINGYPVYTTNQVTAGDVFFGNWADLLIGMWSGIDLLVDPYTGSAAGTVRMVAHQDVDVGLRQPVSFSFGT